MKTFYVTLLFALVMVGCVSPKFFSGTTSMSESDAPTSEKKAAESHNKEETTIPITLPSGNAEVNADIFHPTKNLEPKTVVIMVPGSGNVSRRGEVLAETDSEKSSFFVTLEWAKELANRGISVLSYDKRTCNSRINSICRTNDQKDIDALGIQALANDLDQVYAFTKHEFETARQPTRIVLMSTSQGAQVIAQAASTKSASGVVLMSPVIGDLETMWVSYLARSVENAERASEKNQLLNRKESMISFFASLKKGQFPETAIVRGASVRFWLSWIDATKNTVPRLKTLSRPSLLLFSSKDPYTPKPLMDKLRSEVKNSKVIKMKVYPEHDRNFISSQGALGSALNDVLAFIKTLPPAKS